MIEDNQINIAVIGLGYVGLPLAVEFGNIFPVIGFDIDESRIASLQAGEDKTQEIDFLKLKDAKKLKYSNQPSDLEDCNVYIVTVPTPVDQHKNPNLLLLRKASETVGRVLRNGDVVIYESTVYPGATEEECVPILQNESGLVFNKEFFVGYSPERINPSDKQHRLPDVCKVISGSTSEAEEFIYALYRRIIKAGIHKAPTIKTAEAAKIIENTQRDLNIALINELAIIFNKMNIDTEAVLKAAGTKWNFLSFRPGLVGGHCIGVDPYYLTHKAKEIGYHPEIILAGRRLNDRMASYVVSQFIKAMLKKDIMIHDAHILILGLSFKENCPDLRNTKIIDIVMELEDYGVNTEVYDPWVDKDEVSKIYGIKVIPKLESCAYDGIILAVAHNEFVKMGASAIHALGKKNHLLYDLKYVLAEHESDLRL